MMDTCDVIVIGGGPAGSASAAFLADKGHHVVLLEKESHPRFHIGESLLPHSMPILKRLGIYKNIEEIGVLKGGADFLHEESGKNSRFMFANALTKGPGHAFQVKRELFDHILFENAQNKGAVTIENAEVTEVNFSDETPSVVYKKDSENRQLSARFIVDASGRSALISKAQNHSVVDDQNHSAAIFGHFKNAEQARHSHKGNIEIYLTDHGWMWMIPLPDNVVSVGIVANSDFLASRKTGLDSFFKSYCQKHPNVWNRIHKAEQLGKIRATGNYSYRSQESFGENHLLIGDAYGFLDPMFSTGVHLALIAAEDSAKAIDYHLKGKKLRAKIALKKFEKDYIARMRLIAWYIYRITDPTFRYLLTNPRNKFKVVDAMTSLLAGDLKNQFQVRIRLCVFKVIYFTAKHIMPKFRHDVRTEDINNEYEPLSTRASEPDYR